LGKKPSHATVSFKCQVNPLLSSFSGVSQPGREGDCQQVVLAPRLGLRHNSQGPGRRQNKVVVAFAIPVKKKKQFCVNFREKYAIYMYF
jgi:hypothetical protein